MSSSRCFKAFALLALVTTCLSGDILYQRLQEKVKDETGHNHKVGSPSKESIESSSLSGSYLASRFAARSRDNATAAEYLSVAIKRDAKNLGLMQELLRLQVLNGDKEKAYATAAAMAERESADPLVALLMMEKEILAGRYNLAREHADRPFHGGLYGIVKPAILQWLAIGDGKKSVDGFVKTIEVSDVMAPFYEYQLALMYDVIGEHDKVTTALRKAVQNPTATPYRVVQALANHYLRLGQREQAQREYDEYAKNNPDSSLIPEALPDGDTPAEKVMPVVGDAQEGIAEVFFTTASLLFGQEANNEAFLYLRLALFLRPDFPAAQLMMANYYESMNNYKQAIAEYEKIDPKSVFFHRGQIRTALNYEASGQLDKALSLLDTIAATNERDDGALVTKADLLRSKKRYEEAAEAYTLAINRREVRGQPQDWSLFFARGVCLERSGNWPLAETDLQKALELKPDEPDVLNYLGYSWLVEGKRIEEAKSYIARALEKAPGQAHIVDSMGWAEFMLGNFESAVSYLEQAVDLSPQDPTLNDHLADAYWRSGRTNEARYQWERALLFKPDAAEETKIKEKIANGLPPLPNKTADIRPDNDDKQQPAPLAAVPDMNKTKAE